MTLDVIVLAAGKGTRMKSSLPKVLHPLAGKPLLHHVTDTARQLTDNPISVVIGHGGEQVQQSLPGDRFRWAVQDQQLGTGHAVQQVVEHLSVANRALVLYGDVPFIRPQTLQSLLALVDDNTMAVLTVALDEPAGYGRILRDGGDQVSAIVEEKDATAAQTTIAEVNTGVMAFPPGFLQRWLPQLDNDNAQGEYYLTDLIALARASGVRVTALQVSDALETEGVNSRAQLHSLERRYQQNLARSLQDQGVTIADAARFDCRGQLCCGQDVFIDINTLFGGEVTLGNNVSIGPNCVISDATIGDNVSIKANTVI